jgi:hypothetical protein
MSLLCDTLFTATQQKSFGYSMHAWIKSFIIKKILRLTGRGW